MHVSIGVPGCIFIGFLVGPGALQHEKPCKIFVLSFKIKVLLNNVKVGLGRSPDLIFIDLLSFWQSILQLLEHPMASLLEVDFSIDFEKTLGGRRATREESRSKKEAKSVAAGAH